MLSTAATVDLDGEPHQLPLFAAMLAKAEAAELAVWENIDAMRRAIEASLAAASSANAPTNARIEQFGGMRRVSSFARQRAARRPDSERPEQRKRVP